MSAARPAAHGSARVSRRRPPFRVLAARWAVVLSGAAVLAVVVFLLGMAAATPVHPAYRDLGPCVVVAHAVNGGGVLCADGTVRP